jgi:hypothetical protein
VAETLRQWAADPDAPAKVVYPLAHQYTPAELSFAALKNEDAAVAAWSTRRPGATACCGSRWCRSRNRAAPEAVWTGRRGGWRHADPEHYDVIEVPSAHRPSTAGGARTTAPGAMGPVRYEDTEVSPPGALADEEPDEEHFHEASGKREPRSIGPIAAPPSCCGPGAELQVIQQGGPEAAIAALERFLDSADAPRAEAMAHLIVDEWPRPSPEFS